MEKRKTFQSSRIYFLFFFFFLLGAAIIGRLFYIQIMKNDHYEALAMSQHIEEKVLSAERGKIFFSDGMTVLAENKGTKKVFIAPREIKNIKEVSKALAETLEMNQGEVFEKISDENDPWIFLKEVSTVKGEEIKDIDGVHFEPNFERNYPEEEMASHAVGFCNKENQGQYGLEEYYQKELRGKDGFRKGIVDATGGEIFSLFNEIQDPLDGDDLITTLDFNIQLFAEKELNETVQKYGAAGGAVIISQPSTGDILAMVSLGRADKDKFNPNNFSEFAMEDYKNSVVSVPFEPGSIFKPITMAGALMENVLSPDDTYIDKGEVKIGNHTIRNSDFQAHGQRTMTEVLELSLNTGMVYVQQELGSEKFTDYVQKFNFGRKTGIDLAGEVTGSLYNILNPCSNLKMIEYANASFGQGVSMTPIQVVQAFSAIANQGKMMKPRVVKKIIHPDQSEEDIIPEKVDKPISVEVASRLTAMLVSVVKNGYGKKAGIDGYLIAGKTGTAQVPDVEGGGYFSDKTIHSFVGFAPAFNPEFVMLLKLDDPRGIRFSSDSLAPIFHNIAQYLFTYFGIPPEEQ